MEREPWASAERLSRVCATLELELGQTSAVAPTGSLAVATDVDIIALQLGVLMLVLATSSVFGTGHIVLTGALSGAITAVIAAFLLRGGNRLLESLAIGLLTAGAVFMLRKSANMPQLNNDGLRGFSANDWLAPTITYLDMGSTGPSARRPNRGDTSRPAPPPQPSLSRSTC